MCFGCLRRETSSKIFQTGSFLGRGSNPDDSDSSPIKSLRVKNADCQQLNALTTRDHWLKARFSIRAHHWQRLSEGSSLRGLEQSFGHSRTDTSLQRYIRTKLLSCTFLRRCEFQPKIICFYELAFSLSRRRASRRRVRLFLSL